VSGQWRREDLPSPIALGARSRDGEDRTTGIEFVASSLGQLASILSIQLDRSRGARSRIGECSNVQDCCVLHSDLGMAVKIGVRETIGHGVVIPGARIAGQAMVGMQVTVIRVTEYCPRAIAG